MVIIGRKNDDGNIFSYPLTDAASGLDAVHAGHFPVHENRKIIIVLFVPLKCPLDRLLSIQDPFSGNADIF